jgi:hypothetical protein
MLVPIVGQPTISSHKLVAMVGRVADHALPQAREEGRRQTIP